MRRESPRDVVAVFIPEYVVGHWWENLLHNQSALWLKSRLLFTPGVMVISVPWQLASAAHADHPAAARRARSVAASQQPATTRIRLPTATDPPDSVGVHGKLHAEAQPAAGQVIRAGVDVVGPRGGCGWCVGWRKNVRDVPADLRSSHHKCGRRRPCGLRRAGHPHARPHGRSG